ncbi:helix-turn-helix transcriptional regulator [Marinobacter sp.]|uniref:helix-turn-helix domain-containing protein n=1 Tax=Marinobacter sp. TaxID=50741 RepID=UPI0023553E20|nr:helix-turn-helix transcriptional regulator [Marinobacter sp.]
MSNKQEQFLIDFGKRVRELRKEKRLTQEDVATLCGFQRPYLSDVERGRRNISAKNMSRLAATLGADLQFELIE